MVNPYEFLTAWAREHVNATAYDDNASAQRLADKCLRDAQKAGITTPGLIKAAGGNLANFMLSELNSAADREANRLAAKDK